MLGKPQLIQPRKTRERETVAKIQQHLSEAEGFNSYKEIHLGLKICQELEISDPIRHRIVRSQLKGKLQQELRMARKPCHASSLEVARAIHQKQQPENGRLLKIIFPRESTD